MKPYIVILLVICSMLLSCGNLLEKALNAKSGMYAADEGLVFYYKFEGNTEDSSGNGNHGTAVGTCSYVANDRFGKPDSTFSGSQFELSYLDTGWGEGFDLTSAFSANLWVQYTDFAIDDGTRYFFGIGALYNPPTGFRFYVSKNDETNTMSFVINSSGYTSDEDSLTFDGLWSSFCHAQWNMLTVVHEQGTGADRMHLYMNGIEQTPTASLSNFQAGILDRDIYILAANNLAADPPDPPAAIGEIISYGEIDDFRFYSRALSEDEITALYHENGFDL